VSVLFRDGAVDLLEPALQQYRPKFIYALATYQNPRARSCFGAAAAAGAGVRYRVPVVEDDIYRDLACDVEPPRP
jgi:DNA-binding transcriptional MocR family regulator